MRIAILIVIFIVSFSVVFGVGYLIIPRDEAMMGETPMEQMGDMEPASQAGQMGGTPAMPSPPPPMPSVPPASVPPAEK